MIEEIVFLPSIVVHRFGYIDSFWMARDILDTMGVQGFVTYYILFMALIIGFLLLLLTYWHGKMIARGQTSLEQILNPNRGNSTSRERTNATNRRELVRNWKRFLGVEDMKDFILKILLPSTHLPRGDGIRTDDLLLPTNSISKEYHSDQSSGYILYSSNDHSHYSFGEQQQQSDRTFVQKQYV